MALILIFQGAGSAEPAGSTLSASPCWPELMYEEIVTSHLKEIYEVKDIPEPALQAIGFRGRESLADPEGIWNSTCVVDRRDKIPEARLIFATRTPHFWVIQIETGGTCLSRSFWIVGTEGETPCVRALYPRFGDLSSAERLQHFLQPEWIRPESWRWEWEGPEPGSISHYDGLASGDYRLHIVETTGTATVSVFKQGDFWQSFQFKPHQQLALSNSLLFVTFYSPTKSGTRVVAFDVDSGKRIWEKRLSGYDDDLVRSPHKNAGASLTPDGYWLVVCGEEDGERYTKILSQIDGSGY